MNGELQNSGILDKSESFYRPRYKHGFRADAQTVALQLVGGMPRPFYTDHWQAGVIFRLESFWIGIHWSKTNRRLCVNLLPCLTFYLTLAGGDVPKISDYPHRWAIRK